jgi:hypothetical protein
MPSDRPGWTNRGNRSDEHSRTAIERNSIHLPYDLLGDRLELQVRSAFVNLANLRVSKEFLDGIIFDETVAAEEIDSE